jgi:protein-disulfide isomerase
MSSSSEGSGRERKGGLGPRWPSANQILVACVVVLTARLVYRDVIGPPPPPPPVTSQPDWERYKSADYVHGSPGAPLEFVVFSDYECPACRSLDADLVRLTEVHDPHVAVSIRHVMAPRHKFAAKAAQYAVCGSAVGAGQAVHRVLFDSARSLGDLDPAAVVAAARVQDSAGFATCLAGAQHKSRLSEDSVAQATIRVEGTPTILFNGRRLNGSPGFEFLDALVRVDLQQKISRGP